MAAAPETSIISNGSLQGCHSGLQRLKSKSRYYSRLRTTALLLVVFLSLWFQWRNTNTLPAVRIPTAEKHTKTTNATGLNTVVDQDDFISSPWYRQRKNVKLTFGSKVQFIFTVGLEGTGHHWVQNLITKSPALESLKNAGVWPKKQTVLQTHLFQHHVAGYESYEKTGLFNAHCSGKATNPGVRFRGTVSVLREIEEAVVAKRGVNRTVPFPVNSCQVAKKHGMLSYPNFPGPCKLLNYPDLTLFFQACNRAQVDCFMVYIHRNPVDVLHSNIIKREFLPSLYQASQLYSTMLHAIASQIRNFPDRVLGCLDFFGIGQENFHSWYDAQLDLWDWRLAPDRYKSAVQSKYRTPERNDTLYHELVKGLSQGPAATYMKSFFAQHYQALELCQRVIGS